MSSPFVFRTIGERILGRCHAGREVGRTFIALFGLRPFTIFKLWRLIVEESGRDFHFSPKHLMWALLFLRTYAKEEMLATLVGVTEKTFRRWVWLIVGKLAAIDSLVSEGRYV